MTNLASLIGKPVRKFPRSTSILWPIPQQMIGIEVEAEAIGDAVLPEDNLHYWVMENDGSLLRGKEYVLARPLRGKDLASAVSELFQHPTKLKRSTTGSTHIHLDMTEEKTTAETVKSLVLMLYCLESVLFAVGDPAREWCGYTNKLIGAPDVLLGAIMSSTEDNNFDYLKLLCLDDYGVGRYYGLNLLALGAYGSVEFRYFPTPESKEELAEWIKLVQCFKLAALENSVKDVIDIFNDEEKYMQFVQKYFSDWTRFFLEHAPGYQVLVTVRKAMASINSCYFKEVEEFNPKAITENPALIKFIKKKETDNEDIKMLNVIIPKSGEKAPIVTEVLEPSLLFYQGEIYSNIIGRWSYANERSAFTTKEYWKRMLKTLDTLIPQREQLKLTGYDLSYYKNVAMGELKQKHKPLRNPRNNVARFVIGEEPKLKSLKVPREALFTGRTTRAWENNIEPEDNF